MTLAAVVVAAAVLTSMAAAQNDTSQVEVRGSPSFEVVAQDNRVIPGESMTLDVAVSNAGEIYSAGPADIEQRVQTARNTRASVRERNLHDDVALDSGPVLMGTVPPGLAEPISFRLEFSEDIEPGRYRVPLEIEYDWTRRITRSAGGSETYHEFSTTERTHVTVVVRDGARFRETNTEVDVSPGERGTAEVTFRNTGNRDAHDAVATITSRQPVTFEDGAQATEVSLGDVAEGETVTARFPVRLHEDIESHRFTFTVGTEYRDEDGVQRDGGSTRASFTSAGAPRLDLETAESDLRSGGFGTVALEVTNDGERRIRDLSLVYSDAADVEVNDTRLGVGDIEPGETRELTFRAETPGGVTTTRTLEFTPTYTAHGRRFTATPVSTRAAVAEYTPELRVDAEDNNVEVGDTTTVTFEVENQMNEPAANLTANVEAEEPLNVEYTDAYVGNLEPGESTEVSYDVEVERDTTLRRYPVGVTFEFTDGAGEVRKTRRQNVGVEATGGGTAFVGVEVLIFLVLTSLVAASFVWLYRR
ncbi:MAG: CARDB domain-containing protein [Halobacteriota archaeon]